VDRQDVSADAACNVRDLAKRPLTEILPRALDLARRPLMEILYRDLLKRAEVLLGDHL
jgi:hypothetical protein